MLHNKNTSSIYSLRFSFKGNSSIPLFEIHKSIERKKNKSELQTKTEDNTSNIRGEIRNNRNTTLKCNTHRNELKYYNGHFPDLVQEILRKNNGLHLVLWHAKPSAFIAMLNITLK